MATSLPGGLYAAEWISIHTTLAGGDVSSRVTSPVWVISIHTTLAGGDAKNMNTQVTELQISIHTTLAGGDTPIRTIAYSHPNFNPHHPRGWRRGQNFHFSRHFLISIHTTLAGGDVANGLAAAAGNISIHTTLAGGD